MQKHNRIIIYICFGIMLVYFVFQTYENRMVSQDLKQLDWHVETQFSLSKVDVIPLLEAQTFCPEISTRLGIMTMSTLYGKYIEHAAVGPDSNWHDLLVGMDNVLGYEQSFHKVNPEELAQLVDFLKTHEYRNTPEISEAEVQPLISMLEAAALRQGDGSSVSTTRHSATVPMCH